MSTTTPNAYLRTKVLTASPAELRLMLLDGAIKFAQQGQHGLEEKNYEAAYNGLTRCQAIILELINILKPEHDPKLCERLSALYTYLYTQIIKATTERNVGIVTEVIELLEFERETWRMLMDKLVEENNAAGTMQSTPAAAPALPVPANDGTSGLIGGSVSFTG